MLKTEPIKVTPRDWTDNIREKDGWATLKCSKCKNVFHGWKLKTKCRLCAVPRFPTGIAHITHVAIKYKDVVYSLAAPDRHHHVLRVIHKKHKSTAFNEQGFLTNEGKFVTREEAFVIAKAAAQIRDITKTVSSELFSEDLW